MSSTDNPNITNEAVQIEYYDPYKRITNEAIMIEYDNPGFTSEAVMIEYIELDTLPLLVIGQNYTAST